MEVQEETTSNHLEESIAAATTTVTTESLLENTTSSDKESEKQLSKLISKSNTQEEEDSSVSIPKLEDSEAFVGVAVGEKEGDEKGEEEVLVHCRNSESAAALSGGNGNSVVDIVVESTNVLEYSKDGDEGVVKEIDVPSDDVAAVECDGSELTCSVRVDGGEGEEAAVERNGDLEVVEEKVENDGEDTVVGDLLAIQKNENEGDEMVGEQEKGEDEKETMKEEEGAEVMKGGEGGDVLMLPVTRNVEEGVTLLLPVAHNGEGDEMTDQFKSEDGPNVHMEDVEKIQEMAGSDVRKDGGGDVQLENIDNVQGDEAMAEERVVAEVVKEERMVADEEEAVGVREDLKVEGLIADEETVDGVAENDEQETMVEDEEKTLDTEMEMEEEATIAYEEKVQEAEIEKEAELLESSMKGSGGKRKRGKITKTTPKSPMAPRKTIEEEVCFICFDGGELVLCDQR